MSQRQRIQMTEAEIKAFLQERHHMSIATLGPRGWPHVVAMWYGFIDDAPAFWTYAKSQKIRNLQRDNRITCLVEAGSAYNELRGVELIGQGVILSDIESIVRVGESVYERYTGPLRAEARPHLRQVGAKRLAVRIDVARVASWDHRKL